MNSKKTLVEEATLPSALVHESYREKFATTVVLFRHAPTQFNRDQIIQGAIDTEIIADEAKDYLERLELSQIKQPDLICVSGLQRTYQTALALVRLTGWGLVPIIKDPRFNERSWGVLEGKSRVEANKLYPNFDLLKDTEHFAVPGGEALSEVKARMIQGLIRIRTLYPGRRLIAVTHAGCLKSLDLDPRGLNSLKLSKNSQAELVITRET